MGSQMASLSSGLITLCKLLPLFKIDTMIDAGMKKLERAFVSVLDEYNCHSRPGIVLHILNILHILHIT